MTYVAAVTYRALPGKQDRVRELLRELAVASRNEAGCRGYITHVSIDDPTVFYLYETYEDRAAYDAHRASEHVRRLGVDGIFPLLASREPAYYEPLES
jgi:quinol monooxygenase YgiN